MIVLDYQGRLRGKGLEQGADPTPKTIIPTSRCRVGDTPSSSAVLRKGARSMATKHIRDVHGSNEIPPPTPISPNCLFQVELSGDDEDEEGGVQHITVGIDDVVRVMPWFCIEVSLVFEMSVSVVG